jgi:hypothetical protein
MFARMFHRGRHAQRRQFLRIKKVQDQDLKKTVSCERETPLQISRKSSWIAHILVEVTHRSELMKLKLLIESILTLKCRG